MPFLFRIFASTMSSNKSAFIVYLKGIAMGIADLVPGVSGGTIALITNIYEELISSINRVTGKEIIRLLGSNRNRLGKTSTPLFFFPYFRNCNQHPFFEFYYSVLFRELRPSALVLLLWINFCECNLNL